MKRRDLVKHLTDNGCLLMREGGKYSVYQNPVNQKEVPITRHPEMEDFAARKICRALDIPLL
jgi:predicted RNA binding protein YcfA (HicA-like mRNA interferase family)